MPEALPLFEFAYCDACEEVAAVRISDLEHADRSKRFLGANMTCRKCGYRIASVYKEAPEVASDVDMVVGGGSD